jgi:periplasmic protein TonB
MSSPHPFAALRRVPTPMIIVGGLHLAVLWALLNSLQIRNASPAAPDDMVADVIERPMPEPEKPQPPDVRPSEIKFKLPEPLQLGLQPPIDPAPTLQLGDDRILLQADTEHPVGSAEPKPAINSAALDPRHPLTQPAYPMSAVRDGDTGALFLDILVGTDGRVRDAKVSQSSGFGRLDQAAVIEAKQHWHLRPATRDGVPFEQWLTLKVVFRLDER